jgi:hypothetical protein
MSTDIPKVVGGAELLAKQSAVDAAGNLRGTPIDGVVFRPTRPVPHEDGHVTEVARASWEMLGKPIVQIHITTTLPGRIRLGTPPTQHGPIVRRFGSSRSSFSMDESIRRRAKSMHLR